ncbi:MAG: hypothetical protein OSA99_19125, partial [Acidimicrobiales bacterium]|nr:hypothetical protein [Acidimicrobiales bacterium]
CSDDLSDPDKSDLGGLTAAEWSIVKHDGKTCDQDDPDGKGDDDKKDDKCVAYDFLYTNGARDTGEFCDGNTVTRDDVPDLNAVELHISCSDDFSDPANPDKSDLGGLVVDQFSIVKHDGKTCGSPIEEPQQTITFTCDSLTIAGDVPVQQIRLLYADGGEEVIQAGGLTDLTVSSPDRVIVAAVVDGVTVGSDVVDCEPTEPDVTFDCSVAVIDAPDGVGSVTVAFTNGSILEIDGGSATELTIDSQFDIESVTVQGTTFVNPTPGCGHSS